MKLLELSHRYGFLFLFYLFTVCVWRSEENLVELLLFFHLYVGSWDRTQVVGFGSRHLYLPSPLISPVGKLWRDKWTWQDVEYGTWHFQGICGQGSPSSLFTSDNFPGLSSCPLLLEVKLENQRAQNNVMLQCCGGRRDSSGFPEAAGNESQQG